VLKRKKLHSQVQAILCRPQIPQVQASAQNAETPAAEMNSSAANAEISFKHKP
jgi:hypothetical protein